MDSKANMKRLLILKSATEFILSNDIYSLTLDAVAKSAGISKGGLLYHFPNKEALLKALALYIFEDFNERFLLQAEKDPVEKGRYSRALIELSKWDLDHHAKLNVGIVANSFLDQDLQGSIDELYQSIQTQIMNDGLDPVDSTIIRLAIDGLYFSEMYQIAPIKGDLREQVIQRLLDMTK
ncbi:TetR/AcrR family transcriptional regulator [Cytobacillus purgationiresistens]|uniref:AcrR family transcriptional regulator n=1 Tax=Cytobacillus purgationiresistens TaxID=863449 RepID=A0ABU0AAD3_9BACI|nr:TetR/AcrR family transcriptional regulator [Cytobacillus purgationiresistens]MDQ0268208.1 AcrR family transcriptional regulator [Cytobacillus purgationiresistens]